MRIWYNGNSERCYGQDFANRRPVCRSYRKDRRCKMLRKQRALIVVFCVLVSVLLSSAESISQIETESASILVDASRDGGMWWFPQSGPFDPSQPHQGKALADYLRSLGYTVTELPRPTTITTSLLASHDIVIRANESEGYSSSEITAYQDYVSAGGKLLLLSDFKLPGEQDSLGLSFGITFQGISRGENIVDSFEPHPITAGVSTLNYGIGSGITDFPSTANILGYLSSGTYLDLNDNGMQDPGEPTNAPALGVMSSGNERIVFCGDTNMWLWVPQPLVDNTINWLISPDHKTYLPVVVRNY